MDYRLGIAQPSAIFYKCISNVCTKLHEEHDVYCHDACLRYAHGVDRLLTQSNMNSILDDVMQDEAGHVIPVKRSDLDIDGSRDGDFSEDRSLLQAACVKFCREGKHESSFTRCLMLLCKTEGGKLDKGYGGYFEEDGGPGNFEKRGEIFAQKRWASRMSCAEAQCGAFSNKPQQFYECSVQNCT